MFLVAGGIGITPFLSILQVISSNLHNSENKYPDRIQLIHTIKKSQEICLLDPILPQLLAAEKFHIKLKVFVTRENQIGTTLREVLNNNIPEIQTTNFSTKHSSHATYGTESLFWMAAFAMTSSLMFLIVLVCCNHYIITPAKKPFCQKNSSLVDLLVVCSFAIAMVTTSSMAVVIRWKRLREGNELFPDKQRKSLKHSIVEASRELDIHEIHFGERPKFPGTISITLVIKGCSRKQFRQLSSHDNIYT